MNDSKMILVGIERRADGTVVVHAPSDGKHAAQMHEVVGAQSLWDSVQRLLDDPGVPEMNTSTTSPASIEEALASAAGQLFHDVVRTAGPRVAPVVKQAAQNAGQKASGLFSRLGKADVGIPRYPRGR